MARVSIGAAAKATGVKVPTIRYYEDVGLMPPAPRTVSNRRLYGPGEVARLRFIRHARELGFEVDDIRALVALQSEPQQTCTEVDAIARAHLAEVERRIESLQALKSELGRMIKGCKRGRISQCRIIEVLQDHAQCAHHPRD